MENQISLMTSEDGLKWKRYKNTLGQSRVFSGPGAARDQCVIQYDSLWYMYYTGHLDSDRNKDAILVRSSKDLIHWSNFSVAHYDSTYKKCESPAVVHRDGRLYIFLSNGDASGEPVFVSYDPLHFSGEPITYLNAHACEVIQTKDGSEYISKIFQKKKDGSVEYGIRMPVLDWKKE